jgi:hypothetical protein
MWAIGAALAIALAACGGGNGGGDDVPSDDPSLPGTFVPDQGRRHVNFTPDPDRPPRTPFCDGVATSDEPGEPSVSITPTPDEPTECYASNPPSSGWHLGSMRNLSIGNGITIKVPPDPDTYPADVEIPREAIPHILEHAGVFVGWNCAGGDTACEGVAAEVERIADDRIDNGERVVFAHDNDLPEGTVGMSAWTRVETFAVAEFTQDRVVTFIDTYSCRFDPEGFC